MPLAGCALATSIFGTGFMRTRPAYRCPHDSKSRQKKTGGDRRRTTLATATYVSARAASDAVRRPPRALALGLDGRLRRGGRRGLRCVSFGVGRRWPALYQRRAEMTQLRKRMIEDMQLMGLGLRTQSCYVAAVRRLAAHYRRSPDALSEEEVRAYLIALRDRGIARGTFKHNQHGIQFLYRHTLDRGWPLFSKKNSAPATTEALAGRAHGRAGP